MHPQLPYASTVWSFHADQDIGQLESVQRRATRWVMRDYRQHLVCPQCFRISTGVTLTNGVLTLGWSFYIRTHIPASDYLIWNTRLSSRNHSLAYRQITALRGHYKYTFFPRTIIHWNALPPHIPVLPTLTQFSTSVCQIVHKTH